ncbi:hypothetical protein CK203_033467 [Vitis vinifera]|uniref:Retrovirus-related Pol polyprotein from transposon TNT 1-94 n=1 Tax=Vitis vinifera TaxID=29760 RepID=A0A438FLC8_VITVI|nr:hypothetical protein CK203_033467 [Vitis vinifera]
MDVKTMFLNGELKDEIHMDQPEGCVVPSEEQKCYGIPPEATRYMPQAGTLSTSRWKPTSQPCEDSLVLQNYFAALLSVCEISQTSFSAAKCP